MEDLSPTVADTHGESVVENVGVSGAIDGTSDSQLGIYLEAMEKLRVLLEGNDEVSVPGVVVAGAQSAGKSSVLEALGGMKLPRGQNITTRVPLVLNVRAVPGIVPHALIGGVEDEGTRSRIEIDDISDNIETLTNKLAGGEGGVSDSPIYLTIIRPSGPTLTLIDLPGITFNAADGSSDIHAKTVDLVKKYIRDENMVREIGIYHKKINPKLKVTLVTRCQSFQAGGSWGAVCYCCTYEVENGLTGRPFILILACTIVSTSPAAKFVHVIASRSFAQAEELGRRTKRLASIFCVRFAPP